MPLDFTDRPNARVHWKFNDYYTLKVEDQFFAKGIASEDPQLILTLRLLHYTHPGARPRVISSATTTGTKQGQFNDIQLVNPQFETLLVNLGADTPYAGYGGTGFAKWAAIRDHA